MKNETFLRSLLSLESVKQEKEKTKVKQEKTRKEKQEKKQEKRKNIETLETIKSKNQKWFWISLFWNNTRDKNFLIDYTIKLEKVARKIKSEIIKDIEIWNIKDIETIENTIQILSIENKIQKESIKDQIFWIELEKELTLYIESISWNNTKGILEKNINIKDKKQESIKKISMFFLVSNAMKRIKNQNQKSNEKYEEVNNNFFWIDETKACYFTSEKINDSFIIETLKNEKGWDEFYNIYCKQEEKKEIYQKEIRKEKEILKEKVKEIESFLKNGWKQEEIKEEEIQEIKKIKEKIIERERERNIEKTIETRKIKEIIKSWNIEKYIY